ncbi:hypothetical protein HMPREF1574_01475 [Gardnerella pickettii JCP7659]|nr:hypothetical protein HMPREF1574_01475 [Gardnerella pickettii JCP7659]
MHKQIQTTQTDYANSLNTLHKQLKHPTQTAYRFTLHKQHKQI